MALHRSTLIAELLAHALLPLDQEVRKEHLTIRSDRPLQMGRSQPAQILDDRRLFAAQFTSSSCVMLATIPFPTRNRGCSECTRILPADSNSRDEFVKHKNGKAQ